MQNTIFLIRNKALSLFYTFVLKPILFQIDPEKVHDFFTILGKFLGTNGITRKITATFFNFQNKKYLQQKIKGIIFKNPIGLAAGFDKNAQLINIVPEIGFGFTEIGSITANKCAGNQKPRLWRLKESKSLVVNYGLKSNGAIEIHKRIKKIKCEIPVGISIAKTNCKTTTTVKSGTKDYLKTYNIFKDIGDYDVLNISCPNAYGGEYFTNPEYLDFLLKKVNQRRNEKPLFLKIPCDLQTKEIDSILEISAKSNVDGFICTNLTKNRKNKRIKDKFVPEKGGISGKVVEDLSNKVIGHIYKTTQRKFVIIGCGGIFSAEDAYKKIKLGASLLQLITGMIYQGPQVISEINRGITNLLKKDKLSNISEAVGLLHKK